MTHAAVSELSELKSLRDAITRQATDIESQRSQDAAAAVRKRAS